MSITGQVISRRTQIEKQYGVACTFSLINTGTHAVFIDKYRYHDIHCGIPDSSFKRNLRLSPTGNRKLVVCISGRSLIYFILFFIVFDYSQPVWMLAERRLDNYCSLVIAKCWRNGLLIGRNFKTQWTITANMAFSLRLSVKKMYFPIIICQKKDLFDP